MVFGPSIGFVGFGLVLAVLAYALPIMAIVDVSGKSRVAFYQANSSKTAWIIVLAIGLLLSPLGIFSSAYYFLGVRRRVLRFQKGSDL